MDLPSPAPSAPPNSPSDFEQKDGFDGVVFYRGSRPFEELEFPEEPEDAEDYAWAERDPQVRQQYGGLVVAVRGKKVWGAGKNADAAWEQASKVPDCPVDDLLFWDVPDSVIADDMRKS